MDNKCNCNSSHNHHNCDCNNDKDKYENNCNCTHHHDSQHDCDCNCNHHDEEHFEEDDYCDLDDTKICDNCGKCLDEYNTDEKGFVKVKIDKIIKEDSDISLEDLYKQYGLNDDDEE